MGSRPSSSPASRRSPRLRTPLSVSKERRLCGAVRRVAFVWPADESVDEGPRRRSLVVAPPIEANRNARSGGSKALLEGARGARTAAGRLHRTTRTRTTDDPEPPQPHTPAPDSRRRADRARTQATARGRTGTRLCDPRLQGIALGARAARGAAGHPAVARARSRARRMTP